MEDAYKQLGKEIKAKNIVIAKLNAKTNETPIRIKAYPTILLFKANDNSMVRYDGDRSVESFTAFLKESAVFGAEIKIAGGKEVKYVKVDGPSRESNYADRFDHDEL